MISAPSRGTDTALSLPPTIDFHEILGCFEVYVHTSNLAEDDDLLLKNDWGRGNWQTARCLKLIFHAKSD